MIKGVIYEIVCTKTGDNYIGSTIKSLHSRLNKHKERCKDASGRPNNKLYNCMREYGMDNFTMKPLFVRTVGEVHELRKFEGEVIKDRGPSLNTNITGLYYNKDGLFNKKLYNSDYYKTNKDVLTKKIGEYRENNNEVVAKTHKKYREKNKEVIAEMNKVWREKNKVTIANKKKERVVCECGVSVQRYTKVRHQRSIRHKTLTSDKLNTSQRCEYPPIP